MSKSEAGKGSVYRSVDRAKYEYNYDRIFNKIPDCPICGESLDKWGGICVCTNKKCDGFHQILKGIKNG